MTYKLLAGSTLTSTANYIDLDISSFTSYKHLVLELYAVFPSTTTSGTKIYFNGDHANDSNYYTTYAESASGTIGGNYVAGAFCNFTVGNSSTVRPNSTTEINNFNVSGIKKTIISRFGSQNYIGMYTSGWNNTAAITSIRLKGSLEDFQSGYSYSLYGLA